jgi:hypothetical protein
MPLVVLLAAAFALVIGLVALTPLTLVLRYRAGTARRAARGWVAAVNAIGLAVSAAFFVATAAIASFFVPHALSATLAGLAGGMLLGLLGLLLSRFEATPQALHYTPNRWLVLTLTLVVAARIGYGVWRAVYAWRTTPQGASWLAASGAAGSLATGGVIVGYYLAYWTGLWRRIAVHRRTWSVVSR